MTNFNFNDCNHTENWSLANGLLDSRVNGDLQMSDSERSNLRWDMWCAEPVFESAEAELVQFLEALGISESCFRTSLGESAHSVHARLGNPGFVTILRNAFSDKSGSETDLSERIGFVELVRPVFERSVRKLATQIETLGACTLLGESSQLAKDLSIVLKQKLAAVLSRTLVLELNVLRLRDELAGASPEERFEDFLRKITDSDYALGVLYEYPILARISVETADQWVRAMFEMLQRLVHDIETLKQVKWVPDDARLVSVSLGAGDTHRQGRSVAILDFGVVRLLYKPHSLAGDVAFHSLVTSINKANSRLDLRVPKAIDRGNYGWAEHIESSPCESEDEVSRFYERHGALLALLHALAATDFHLENIIAAGEHPVPVDLEALFHPDPAQPNYPGTAALAHESLASSVLSVGLLPSVTVSEDRKDSSRMDMSGLSGGRPGARTISPVATFRDIGTDSMRLIRDRVPAGTASNLPAFEDKELNPLEYADEILRGHERMYSHLLETRDAWLREDGLLDSFSEAEVRIILRPTQTYGHMLHESYHPDLMRDSLDRDRFFSNLWAAQFPKSVNKVSVIRSELQQLSVGDVPIFTTTASSIDVIGGDGAIVDGLLTQSGLSNARNRLQSLSREDLANQQWFIKGSLAALAMGKGEVTGSPSSMSKPASGASATTFMDKALAIGDQLVESAITDDSSATWLGINFIDDRLWQVGSVGIGSYSGSVGIAHFLLYLWKETGERKYKETAELALDGAVRDAEFISSVDEAALTRTGIGVFSEVGGLIYVLSHAAVVFERTDYLDAAYRHAQTIRHVIEDDTLLDVVSGSAGSILALLSLYSATQDKKILDLANDFGEHLAATAVTEQGTTYWPSVFNNDAGLVGYSHGASGIAVALSRLAEFNGNEELIGLVEGALAYEDKLWSDLDQNWPDLRSVASLGDRYHMNTWCHGSVGVGMARLDLLDALPDLDVSEELRRAVAAASRVHKSNQNILSSGNHCICHGDLGNAEFLSEAGVALGDADVEATARQLREAVAGVIDRDSIRCGVPFGVETPGLMNGIAGTGFAFLRAASPTSVPSVLRLHGVKR